MHSRSLMFLAGGNMAAALYHERMIRRRSYYKFEEDTYWSLGYEPDANAIPSSIQRLATYGTTKEKLDKIIAWMYKASDADLCTCRVGLSTAGNMVAWSYRTRVERRGSELCFTGKYGELPVGKRFSKIILTMANGDEIARRALQHSIDITEGVAAVSATYTIKFS